MRKGSFYNLFQNLNSTENVILSEAENLQKGFLSARYYEGREG